MDGEVENPLKFGWAEFLALPQVESVSDFHCVEGWSVLAQRWRGVLFATIQERGETKARCRVRPLRLRRRLHDEPPPLGA